MNAPLAPWFMAVLSAVWAVGLGLRGASVQTLVLDLAPSERGAATGLLQVTYAAGIMLGSSAGGLALGLAGYSGLSYLLAGACVVSAVIYWQLRNESGTAPDSEFGRRSSDAAAGKADRD
jgi:predicted MFS family arabinose efflux permease